MRSAVWVVVVVGVGCQSREPDSKKDLGVARAAQENLAERMALHDAQGLALRDAVVRGELSKIKGPATWMAEHMPDAVVPDSQKSLVDDMRGAARRLAASKNLSDAARSLAVLAAACGRCHQQTSRPNVFVTEPPAETSEVIGRMERHVWATDRMWDGIVGPSDDAWVAGSKAIQDPPLRVGNLAPGGENLPLEVSRLARQVKELGVAAGQTTQSERRAKIYGELLSTCAHCHGLLRSAQQIPGTPAVHDKTP